jgi:beta-mannosidase
MNTIKKFSIPEDWSLTSPVMQLHERHASGFGNLQYYLSLYYQNVTDFEMFVYVSQSSQTLAMRIAVESHRRNKPYSMGTIMWQLNDIWPVASWSGVDFYGTWKST